MKRLSDLALIYNINNDLVAYFNSAAFSKTKVAEDWEVSLAVCHLIVRDIAEQVGASVHLRRWR